MTAPLILVPAMIPDATTSNIPVMILDLGHLVVKHDSGPPEEIVDYTYFFIQLERIGAYVQNSDASPLPLGAIIEPFSINLDIGTKYDPKLNTDLPATTVKGRLAKLSVCVTTEKVKDILRVVTSIQPPPPKKDEDFAVHKKRLLKMQRRGMRLTESVGSLTAQAAADWSRLSLVSSGGGSPKQASLSPSYGISTSKSASLSPGYGNSISKRDSVDSTHSGEPEQVDLPMKTKTKITRESTLDLLFHLGKVTVMVRGKPDADLPEGEALVKAKIAELDMQVQVSNWDTNASLTLDRFVLVLMFVGADVDRCRVNVFSLIDSISVSTLRTNLRYRLMQ